MNSASGMRARGPRRSSGESPLAYTKPSSNERSWKPGGATTRTRPPVTDARWRPSSRSTRRPRRCWKTTNRRPGATMPRRCTVCAHPDREAVDEALVDGTALSTLSAKYRVSEDALGRHKGNHLPAKLVIAQAAEEIAQADSLLNQVRDLQSRAYGILDKAEGTGDLRTALGAIREARGNLELLAKILGELDERPVLNLNVSPEWLELRAVIVGALAPYSEARDAVLRAIEGSG